MKFTPNAPFVDNQLRLTLSLLIRDFICTWYFDLSNDEEFINSLLDIFIYLLNKLSKRFEKMDWTYFALKQFPEVLRRHLHDYRHSKEKIGTTYGSGRTLEDIFHGKTTFGIKS